MSILHRCKTRVFSLIRDDDENSSAANILDFCLITLIVVNVLLVIADTFKGVPPDVRSSFPLIEDVSVAIFTVEYLLRLWTADLRYPGLKPHRARLRYIHSFMALVDLLAILPFYLPFIFPFDMRVLRTIRLMRLLRLLKVNRYTNALTTVANVLKRKASQLLSSFFIVLILMVIASILMYNIESEAQPEVFQNAFSGFWWAIATLTTVGYGDIYPVTVLGKMLAAVIALLGIALVAVPTGIISAGFMEVSQEREKTGGDDSDSFGGLTPEERDKVAEYARFIKSRRHNGEDK